MLTILPLYVIFRGQFRLTFPVFVRYGAQLWVPEVGGTIDPDSEADDLIMMPLCGRRSDNSAARVV